MKHIVLIATALALTAVLTSGLDVQASDKPPSSGKPSGPGKSGPSSIKMSTSKYSPGKTFSRYYGRNYWGWSRYCWFPEYNCYGYCYPDDGVWFYWCEAEGHYLPITYLTMYPPTTAGIAPTGGTQTGGSLPPGATVLPANPAGTSGKSSPPQ